MEKRTLMLETDMVAPFVKCRSCSCQSEDEWHSIYCSNSSGAFSPLRKERFFLLPKIPSA